MSKRLAEINTQTAKLRSKISTIDRGIQETVVMVEHDHFFWSVRRQALNRDKAEVQRQLLKLQSSTSVDDSSTRSAAIFYGSNT